MPPYATGNAQHSVYGDAVLAVDGNADRCGVQPFEHGGYKRCAEGDLMELLRGDLASAQAQVGAHHEGQLHDL